MSYKDLTRGAPYNDDFNPELNFLRILSVPGRPIQARELTQAQTILQNQIAQVSNHLFRNGTPVLGAKINLNTSKPGAVFHNRLVDRVTGTFLGPPLVGSNPGAMYSLSDFIGRKFNNVDPLGQNTSASGVATKTFTITHAVISGPNEEDLILYFTFGGSPVQTDNLYFDAVGSGGTVLKAKGDLFFGLSASCEPGVVYRDGNFVSVMSQEIIVGPGKDHATNAFAIGFRFDERLITEADPYFGATLLDNAQGFYNQAAPGAHRYQVMPVLDFYDLNYVPDPDSPGDNLFPTTEFNQWLSKFSSLVETRDGKITLDQRDTQYAKLLDLLARRTYDESGNYTVREFSLGVSESALDGANLVYNLGPGKAYVLGYEIEKLTTTPVTVEKAREYIGVNNTYAQGSEHAYFIVDNASAAAGGVPVGSPMIFRNMNLEAGIELTAYNVAVDRSTGASISRADPTARVIGTCRVHSLVKYGNEWRIYITDASSSLANNAGSVKSLRLTSSAPGASEPVIVVKTFEESRGSDIAGTAKVGGSFRDPLVYGVDGATILKNVISGETSYLHMVKKEGVFNGAGAVSFTADNIYQEFFTAAEDGIALLIENNGGNWVHVTNPTVTINNASDPATIVLTTDASHAGRPVIAYLKVLESEGSVRTKTLDNFVETPAAFIPNSGAVLTLAKEDCVRIVGIRQMTNVRSDYTSPYNLTEADIAKLKFDNGQRDFFYDNGSITAWNRLDTYANTGVATQFEITYEYFNHSAGAHGFFCVNSYPFSANDLDLVPNFKASNGKTYKMVNCIDFRSKRSEIAGRTMLQPNTRFRTDIETYLGRKDRVVLTSTGVFNVVKGIGARNPILPNEPSNAVTLYTVSLNPYTFNEKDLKVTKICNKRYTMKDIGALDKRLSNLEEYVSMSLLELRANDMEIIDANTGFNKFKNGIFADPFRNHQFGDTTDLGYRAAVEMIFGGGIICPNSTYALDMDIVSQPTTWDNTITLPSVAQEVFIKNEYASGGVNLNPYLFYTWNGTVELDPSVDTWIDTNRAPDIINQEEGTTTTTTVLIQPPPGTFEPAPTFSMPTSIAPVVGFGNGVAWINEVERRWGAAWDAANARFEEELAAWSVRQAQIASQLGLSSTTTTTTTSVGDDRVIATSIAPFMRSIPVAVHARGMRQGAPVKGYLDNHEVILYPSSSEFVTPTGDPAGAGRPRVSDDGEFIGTFTVPPGVIPTGTKQFLIIDDEDASSASTTFTANGSIQTRQRTITSVRNTSIIRGLPTIPEIRATVPSRPRQWRDPIAQSFLIEEPNGCFLESIEVFFKKIPVLSDGVDYQAVSIYIVEMENGTPTNRIVPFSMAYKSPAQCNVSATIPSDGATRFTFRDPVYLEGNTEYAFVLFTNSRKYEAWISTLGEQDIFDYYARTGEIITPLPPEENRSLGIENEATLAAFNQERFRSTGGETDIRPTEIPSDQPTIQNETNGGFLPRIDPTIAFRGTNSGGRGIAEQPYLGSLFKSQNSTTWTPDQMSDITFRIYRHRFATAPSTVVLRDKKTLPSNQVTDVGGASSEGYGSINQTGTSIYPFPDQVYGDQLNNPGALKVSMSVLNVGEMVLPGTSAQYSQAFHNGESGSGFQTITNKEFVYLTEEKCLDNNVNTALRRNYSAQIALGTTDPLLTPVIDKQQMRLITGRYLTSPYDLSDPALPLIDAPAFDFGPAWDAGTYVTKAINLVNPSDDLKVLVDAKLPNDSLLKIYYRTSVITPSYFDIGASTVTSTALIGKTCRLIYREIASEIVGNPNGTNPNLVPSFTSSSNPRARCLVTDVQTPRVYIKSINDISKFKMEGDPSLSNIDRSFLVDEATAVDMEAQSVQKVDDWNAIDNYADASGLGGTFVFPQYVFHASRLWKRNASFTEYAPGMEPAIGGSAWIDIPYAEIGTPVTAGEEVEWREMVLDEDVNPNISVGTRFVEYKYKPSDVPEEFTSFAIKIEMYSKNTIDVPIVKNLRAIAVI
jgi:hypothetical protein